MKQRVCAVLFLAFTALKTEAVKYTENQLSQYCKKWNEHYGRLCNDPAQHPALPKFCSIYSTICHAPQQARDYAEVSSKRKTIPEGAIPIQCVNFKETARAFCLETNIPVSFVPMCKFYHENCDDPLFYNEPHILVPDFPGKDRAALPFGTADDVEENLAEVEAKYDNRWSILRNNRRFYLDWQRGVWGHFRSVEVPFATVRVGGPDDYGVFPTIYPKEIKPPLLFG